MEYRLIENKEKKNKEIKRKKWENGRRNWKIKEKTENENKRK